MPNSIPHSPPLVPSETGQTPVRVSNDAEFQIYLAAAEALGWPLKTYDEWLAN